MPDNPVRRDPYRNFNFRVEVEGAIPKNDLEDKAIEKPVAVPPPKARAARASGAVRVEVVVDAAGKVIAAQSLDGHKLLRRSATAAAKRTRFKPTMLAGQPVKVTGTIVVSFVMR